MPGRLRERRGSAQPRPAARSGGDTPPTSFLTALETTGELARLAAPARPWCLLAHYHRYLRIFDPSHGKIAIRFAEQAIAAGDRPDDAFLTIGVVHAREQRRDLALQAFRRAIELNPRNAHALGWAAGLYSDRGDLANTAWSRPRSRRPRGTSTTPPTSITSCSTSSETYQQALRPHHPEARDILARVCTLAAARDRQLKSP